MNFMKVSKNFLPDWIFGELDEFEVLSLGLLHSYVRLRVACCEILRLLFQLVFLGEFFIISSSTVTIQVPVLVAPDRYCSVLDLEFLAYGQFVRVTGCKKMYFSDKKYQYKQGKLE